MTTPAGRLTDWVTKLNQRLHPISSREEAIDLLTFRFISSQNVPVFLIACVSVSVSRFAQGNTDTVLSCPSKIAFIFYHLNCVLKDYPNLYWYEDNNYKKGMEWAKVRRANAHKQIEKEMKTRKLIASAPIKIQMWTGFVFLCFNFGQGKNSVSTE